jgi:transcriptional regulator with PAS, ATPase and Fis domain
MALPVSLLTDVNIDRSVIWRRINYEGSAVDKTLTASDEMTLLNIGEKTGPISFPLSPAHAVPWYPEFLGMTAVIASTSMRHLIDAAAKVARTNSPVLITGESGTGKELIARAVHHLSPRAAQPFIDVNCAALPEHLIESELFGYERGAFSGADSSKPGLFETAQGGTIFLDEIGELEVRMQAKLLRVLDGQPYFRLGGTRKVRAEARVVAATNLEVNEVTEGKLRRDLYHRLDVFHLRVPALRERVEDIAPLAELFLRGTGFTLSPEALAILGEYSWPGNVRELKNALGKSLLFAEGRRIHPADLPPELTAGTAFPEDAYSLDGIEQQTIFKVLAQTGGHQQRAADLLGISRRTLIRKLKIYRSPDQSPPDQSQGHRSESAA